MGSTASGPGDAGRAGFWLALSLAGCGFLPFGPAGSAVAAAEAEEASPRASSVGDFDGDGKDDILLRCGDGRWRYYAMNGRSHIAAESGPVDMVADPAWALAGVGDLNGDGRDDALLRHADGRWRYYALSGRSHIAAESGPVDIPADAAWSLAGVGDFDGDGNDDVLLRHDDLRWHYHRMDGHEILAGSGRANLTRNPGWRVAGIGDLDGDGKDDVLLRKNTGGWYYYAMDGRRFIVRGGAGLTRKAAYRMAGLGDFDGDGRDDVLLRRNDGLWYRYPMNGREILPGRGSVNLTRGAEWRLAGIGDMDGDGKDDILLRKETGTWFYYPMNGRRYISGRQGTANLTADLGWRPAGGTEASFQDCVDPPPLGADPPNLSALADGFRTREFANNPTLHEMNAHWAYARGVTGDGETIGMTDSGLYAAHVDFRGRLHGETVYTVIGDDVDGDGAPEHNYFKVADAPPETAYPPVSRDLSEPCASTGRQCLKFLDYGHGTNMAALAVGARDGTSLNAAGASMAHGLAFDATLRFLPMRQRGASIGSFWYRLRNRPLGGQVTRHDQVRNLGNEAPVVSNAWLTHHSTFTLPDILPPDEYHPFFWALGPNYAGYQSERDVGERAVLVWSACNIPSTDGPKCGEAALPSLTERQLRAATGGATGLADVVLTDEQRGGLSSAEALRRAEAIVAAWRKHWLAVTSVNDADFELYSPRPVDCALMDSQRRRDAEECAVDYTMINTSRCGFASDWCVAAGSVYASLQVSPGGRVPGPEDGYVVLEYQTSPASAAAGAALGLLLQAYRGADGVLTVGTHKVLERLKLTANAGIFDYDAAHSPDGRSLVRIEEEQIRALIGIAGATDDELRDLIAAARADFASLLPEIAPGDLNKEESGGKFTSSERTLIAAAKDGLSSAQMERFQILSRLSDYFSSHWRKIDTFAPQLGRIKKLLDETDPSDSANTDRANDLLARLIRQVEWIDEQLRRIGRSQASVTNAEIRRITVTSMIGHGLIDLKAATDPAK